MTTERDMRISVRWPNLERPASTDQVRRHVRKLDSGGTLVVPFTATFTDDDLQIDLVLDVRDGAPACTSYTVTSVGGVGLENRTTEVARGLKIRNMMANALALSVQEQHGDVMSHATTVELIESVMGSVKRRREPVTDERLREVAEAYRERWKPGGASEFADSIHCSERQMYRLVKLARERGFLNEGE